MRLIMFDMDGTLVDSAGLVVAAMGKTFAAEGLEPPEASAVRDIIGLSVDGAVARLADTGDSALIATLASRFPDFYRDAAADAKSTERLFPGVRETLQKLLVRDDCVLGIATGMGRRGVQRVLDTYRLEGTFSTVQTADTNLSKPDPAMLEAATRETGIGAADMVMIGDTVYDMAMAVAAGAAAVGVSWGNHRAADLRAVGAAVIVDHFSDLPGAIDQVMEASHA